MNLLQAGDIEVVMTNQGPQRVRITRYSDDKVGYM